MSTLDFTLSDSIKVSIGGDFTVVDTLELHAPPAKEKKLPIRLRKAFMKAVMSAGGNTSAEDREKAKEKSKDKDLKGSDIEMALFSSDIDIEKYMVDFRTLVLVDGVCTVGGQKFLQAHWDGITADDATRLMGEYLAHFFVPSWIPKETTTD